MAQYLHRISSRDEMKIHLGCGLVYKKGYVNIDAFDTTIADYAMSAYHLDFDDNVANLIECMHVIEHLGAAKSMYALAECFRVLTPGGSLLLETPDIEAAFKTFLKRGEKQREYLMNWIYGLDAPGMAHRFCFPKDLLSKILTAVGFVQISIKREGTDSIQPVLQVACKKSKQPLPYQTIAWVRRVLLKDKTTNLDDQITILDKEMLLQSLTLYALEFCKGFSESLLNNMIIEVAVHNPRMVLTFLKEGIRLKLLHRPQVTKQLQIVNELVELDFPAILLHLLKQMPPDVGTQQEVFSTIEKLGMKSIEKLLSGKEQSTIFEELHEKRKTIPDNQAVSHFSESTVQQLADKQFALSAKAFAQEKLSVAAELFQQTLGLNRDNILIPWNLARITRLQGDLIQSKDYYNKAEILAKRYRLPHRRRILDRLHTEQEQISKGRIEEISRPIFHAM